MKSSAMILAAGLISASAFQAAAEVRFTAGVQPDRRPEGAPRITEVFHPRDWYVRALTGITPPYPHSLFFLDAQGDWYSPFILPGMPGRYDIRGWHVATQPKP